MDNLSVGRRITSPEGSGEVLTIFDGKVILILDNGQTTTLPAEQVRGEIEENLATDLKQESPQEIDARAHHASDIAAKLNDKTACENSSNQFSMAFSANEIDVINDLIHINNDRVEGFEKAIQDLEHENNELTAVFNKLAGESQANADQLTQIVQQSGADAEEGTSTAGSLHRAWLDVKSVFTGADLEAILSECECGEDAIKGAYKSALDPGHALNPELTAILKQQLIGINGGHDLIKSFRDQARVSEIEDDFRHNAAASNPDYPGEDYTGAPAKFESAEVESAQSPSGPETDSIIEEQDWQEQQSNACSNSKLMKFFVEELKDLLWAEKELVDILPDMAKAATTQELKTAFANHLQETEVHVSRLEQAFGILGLEPDTTKCDAMAGIVEEGDNIISFTEEGTAQRDVGLIFAGQKAEHYEIASYGGMISLAKTLGYYEIAELLVLTIDEEKSADALLTEIAENHVNYSASIETEN
ncbi:DUF892 family protein [Mucilaginibacter sp.]|uniref:DUF892 family protein n=1 Tax=Mucilaginibacter sp. TaxID=1882438 RepID=UPI003D0A0F20